MTIEELQEILFKKEFEFSKQSVEEKDQQKAWELSKQHDRYFTARVVIDEIINEQN